MLTRLYQFLNRIPNAKALKDTLDHNPTRKEIGEWGEKVSVQWLRKNENFKILFKNWHYGKDEIDIIALQGKILVFVEVRTRSELSRISGFQTINRKKKKALLRVCKAYLHSLREPPANYRFDVAEVEYRSFQHYTVRHFENVKLFPDTH